MKTRALLLLAALASAAPAFGAGYRLYVGTYTPEGGASRGLYAVTFDPASGSFGQPVLAAEMHNPSFLALRPDGRVLYALDEDGSRGGGMGGGVAAFALDAATGNLRLLNRRTATGASSAHLAVDATGRMVVAASYTGGQIAAFPLRADGSLGERSAWITVAGRTGPNAARQDRPHPHCVTFSPDNRFAYVCDLGLDRIFCYRIDPAAGSLAPGDPSSVACAPGAGPRHSRFSADGRFLYVINELNGTIAAYACNPDSGALTPGPVVSTLPASFAGANTCAEIQIHPNGRFVYGSNRGHDSLAVFSRDAGTGRLSPVGIVPCGGRHPRHFALSPDGAWLVCANRDTDDLVAFRVDPATGLPAPVKGRARVPQAVCVLFTPAD